MISLSDLRYFTEISKTLNMRLASQALHVTQPALSHSLKKLEEAVGAQLFHRSKKGVTLTESGRAFQGRVQELIGLWETLSDAKDEIDGGRITVGCHPSVARYSLPRILGSFLKKYPKLEVSLFHDLSRHVTRGILDNKVDLGIVINPASHAELIIKNIGVDEVTLWKSKRLKNEDVLIYDPGLAQCQWILRELEKRKKVFTRRVESSNLEVIASLVLEGAGIGILPARVLDSTAIEKAFPGAPVYQDQICLVFKPNFRSRFSGQDLVKTLTESFS